MSLYGRARRDEPQNHVIWDEAEQKYWRNLSGSTTDNITFALKMSERLAFRVADGSGCFAVDVNWEVAA